MNFLYKQIKIFRNARKRRRRGSLFFTASSLTCLSDPVMLRQSFEKVGFRDVTVRELTVPIEVNSIQDYIRSVRKLNTTIQSIESNLPAKRQELIWDNVTKEIVKRGLILRPRYKNHGKKTDYNKNSKQMQVKFENKTIFITGSKC
jgi:hypothetical protein